MSVIFCYARLEEIGCSREPEERMRLNPLPVALIHTNGTSTNPLISEKYDREGHANRSKHLFCELAIYMERHGENVPRQSD